MYGDFRGRFDEQTTDNPGNKTTGLNAEDQIRLRYRLRVGLLVSMLDDLQVGFSLGSGNSSGNALSNNTTLENNGTKKPIYVDTAFGKWTPINDSDAGCWRRPSGRCISRSKSSHMVFDPDYTPEGAALQGTFKFNDDHSIGFNTAAFVLDNVSASGANTASSTRDPWMYGGQVLWNANWTSQVASSMGFAAYNIVNKDGLGLVLSASSRRQPQLQSTVGWQTTIRATPATPANGNLLYWYNPIVASASVTYSLDSFPLYKGKFPIKPAGEYMYNPGAPSNNEGYWVGVTLGKSGKKGHVGCFLPLSIPRGGRLV